LFGAGFAKSDEWLSSHFILNDKVQKTELFEIFNNGRTTPNNTSDNFSNYSI